MKYADLYPKVKPMNYAENGLLVSDKERGCLICGAPTRFIEVCSESYFCSEECVDKFYKMADLCFADKEKEAD